MAESLGVAELSIGVDLQGLETGLRSARRLVESAFNVEVNTQQAKRQIDALTTLLEKQNAAFKTGAAAASQYAKAVSAITSAGGTTQRGPILGGGPNAAAQLRAAQAAEAAAIQRQQPRTVPTVSGPILGGGPNVAAQAAQAAQTASTAEKQLQRERLSTANATLQAVRQEQTLQGQTRRNRFAGIGGQLSGVLSSSIIGGAFPLLFGQGTGAAAGGFTGGLLGSAFGGGGGFAGSLVGTAIGQTADQFNILAKALEQPAQALPKLIEGSNLSGPGIEKLATTLIELGRTAEAESLILSDLGRTIDPVVATSAAAAQDAYNRSIADFQERLGAFLAGPAGAFTNWLIEVIERASGIPAAGAAPSTQSALAQRGQGTALGIGGTLLAGLGLGLTATGVGAPIGIPLAVAGAGVAASGALQIGAAETQEAQVANAGKLASIFENINSLQSQRIALQRQLVSLSGEENTNTQEIAKLNKDAALAGIEIQKQQARARYQASPTDPASAAGAAELRALQLELQALGIEAEKVEKAFQKAVAATAPKAGSLGDLSKELEIANERLSRLAVDAGSINFRGAVADVASLEVALREAQGATAGVKADLLSASIAAGELARSFDNVNSVLQNLEQFRGTLDIDSSSFVDATRDIVETRNQLQQLDGKKAVIEAKVTIQGIKKGTIDLNVTNLQSVVNNLQTALNNSTLGSEVFYNIQDASILAQRAFTEASNSITYAAVGVKDAGASLAAGGKEAAKAVFGASEQLKGLLQSNFNLLQPDIQEALIKQAEGQVNTGIINPKAIKSVQDLFAAANLSGKLAGIASGSITDLNNSLKGLGDAAANAAGAVSGSGETITTAQLEADRAMRYPNVRFATPPQLKPSEPFEAFAKEIFVPDKGLQLDYDDRGYIKSNTKAIEDLNKKTWEVNVSVDAGTGASSVQLG